MTLPPRHYHARPVRQALKREIFRNPKSDEYRKALKGTGERLKSPSKF